VHSRTEAISLAIQNKPVDLPMKSPRRQMRLGGPLKLHVV
jgi:hypothetical protein